MQSRSVGSGHCCLGVGRLGLEVDAHFHLVLRLRVSGAVPPLPICFHGVDSDFLTLLSWHYPHGANVRKQGTSTPSRLPRPFDVVSCPMQVSCVQSRSVLGCKVNYCPRRNSVCRRCPPWRPGSFPSAVHNATDAPPVGPVEPVVLP